VDPHLTALGLDVQGVGMCQIALMLSNSHGSDGISKARISDAFIPMLVRGSEERLTAASDEQDHQKDRMAPSVDSGFHFLHP
jgi:hypothetical protein